MLMSLVLLPGNKVVKKNRNVAFQIGFNEIFFKWNFKASQAQNFGNFFNV